MVQFGMCIFLAGVAGIAASILFVAPGVSRIDVFMRGSFQRKRDYTPFGWRLHRSANLVAFAGLAVSVLSMFFGE